ncbi:hypothetical protein Tco_0690513, partial [Tanacetum coccineum]
KRFGEEGKGLEVCYFESLKLLGVDFDFVGVDFVGFDFDFYALSKSVLGTDIAKITRKRSKPDKHEHGNGKSAQEPEVGNPKANHWLIIRALKSRDEIMGFRVGYEWMA